MAAIAIALRALPPAHPHGHHDTGRHRHCPRLYAQTTAVRPVVEQLRTVADALTATDSDLDPSGSCWADWRPTCLPHERAEEAELLPIMAKALGGSDPTGAISRTHAEIEHQIGRLRRILDDLAGTVDPEDVVELRRLLYGLYAILRLPQRPGRRGRLRLVPGKHQWPDHRRHRLGAA